MSSGSQTSTEVVSEIRSSNNLRSLTGWWNGSIMATLRSLINNSNINCIQYIQTFKYSNFKKLISFKKVPKNCITSTKIKENRKALRTPTKLMPLCRGFPFSSLKKSNKIKKNFFSFFNQTNRMFSSKKLIYKLQANFLIALA